MYQYRLNRNSLIAAAIIVAVIVYGSLYPFKFFQPNDGVGPVRTLLESWAEVPGRGDFLANILLYMPLGFFGLSAITGKARVLQGVSLTVIAGTALSTSMELAQYYIEGRVTAADDIYANAIGTMLGASIGGIAQRDFRWPLLYEVASKPAPCLLLSLWLGYRLFPYVPTIDLHKYWDAIKPVVLYPSLTGYELFRYTAVWLTLAALIEAMAGTKRAGLLFPLFIGSVVVAKVLIVNNVLRTAELAGAGLALVIWVVLAVGTGPRFRATVIALLLCAYVVAERLSPFQFTAVSRSFGWVPFLSFINGSLEVNIMSFFEKAFLYGSLVWLLGKSGLGFGTAAFLVAMMLAATSWAELYLPNRSAEITDALMAALIGAIIALLESKTGKAGEAKSGREGASVTGTS